MALSLSHQDLGLLAGAALVAGLAYKYFTRGAYAGACGCCVSAAVDWLCVLPCAPRGLVLHRL